MSNEFKPPIAGVLPFRPRSKTSRRDREVSRAVVVTMEPKSCLLERIVERLHQWPHRYITLPQLELICDEEDDGRKSPYRHLFADRFCYDGTLEEANFPGLREHTYRLRLSSPYRPDPSLTDDAFRFPQPENDPPPRK
jgi:hypothetical protein